MKGGGDTTTCSFQDNPAGGNAAGQSNAYLTKITNPSIQSQTFTYNYALGDLSSSTDENAQTTSYYYNDPFDRLTDTDFPKTASGQQKITSCARDNFNCWTGPVLPFTVSTSQLIANSAPPKTSSAINDGMFHVTHTQLTSDPSGTDYVDTAYDGLGRARIVSNPHRSTGWSTDGTTLTQYDALGRPYSVQEQDGSTVLTAYDQTCSWKGYALGTRVTDEAGNQRVSCSDGLGRLVEVDEPGATPPTQATGSVTIRGSEQSVETTQPQPATLIPGITVSGSEQTAPATSGSAGASVGQYGGLACTQNQYHGWIPANGSVSLTVYGPQTISASAGWGGSCDQYGNFTFQPPGGFNQIASTLASGLNTSWLRASSNGTQIAITALGTGAATNYAMSGTSTSYNNLGGLNVSYPSALSGGANAKPDTGTVSVIVNGYTASVSYGSGSTTTSVLSGLVSALNGSSSPVTAPSTNPFTVTSKATGTASDYSGTTASSSSNGFRPPSFSVTPSSFVLTGGVNPGYTYDTGTVSITVGGVTASVNYGASDSVTTIANNLANALNTASGSLVTATVTTNAGSPPSATINLTSVASGTQSDLSYSATSSSSLPQYFPTPSFSTSTGGQSLNGGQNYGSVWSMSTPFVTLYTYDALGNLTCVEQHGGSTGTGCSSPASSDASSQWRVRRFGYDSLSRLTSVSNPETGFLSGISYSYDANGNVSSKTGLLPNQNAAGTSTVVTSYLYDPLNRLIQKTYSDSYTFPVQYGYDGVSLSGCAIAPPGLTDSYPVGRRTSMCDGSGGTSWSHDQMGRTVQESRQIGAASSSISYVPNIDGSVASIHQPPLQQITYQPNGVGQAINAVDSGDGINFANNAVYAPPGELSNVTFGNSIYGAVSYSPRLQPSQIFYGTNTPPALGNSSACPGTVGNIMHRAYNFNFGSGDNGNVISIANCLNSARSESFTYDPLNRITSAESNGPQWGETYSIDAWGNLFARSGISGKTYTEPLSTPPATMKNQLFGYGYDPAGNMTGNGAYVYDAENRIVWTSGYRYVYDGDGQRVAKCAVASATTACPTSGTGGTLYWRDLGGETLSESDLGGNLQEQYVFFDSHRIARRDVTSSGATVALHYYFSDHLGTHAVVTNAAGTQCEQDIDYYPFGGQQNEYCTTPLAQHSL